TASSAVRVGSWTAQAGGLSGTYYTTPGGGDGSATATWTFTGLTAGATYQLAVTWPATYGFYDAPFTVLDGGKEVSFQRVYEYSPPGDFSAGGAAWKLL